MLALYDLCAVLTPCGPLKMLVGLMQERNEPLPGLLYEANLPPPTDFSQPQQRSQYQENVAIPSPMSLGVGIGFGSWSMMMGTPGFSPPADEDRSTGRSDQMSQASSDAGVDLETSGHGLLPVISSTSGNISLTEPPVVRRKAAPPSSTIPSSAPPPHYDGRSESHPPMNPDEEFDKGVALVLSSSLLFVLIIFRQNTQSNLDWETLSSTVSWFLELRPMDSLHLFLVLSSS
jgi:hypothetical protein